MAIDVSAVHPLPLSHVASATVSAGVAAQKRESAKVELYRGKCSSRVWGFTAFVGETTGAWGQAAQRTVRVLVRAKCLRTGDDPQEVARAFWDSLGRAMAMAVARQLVNARTLSGAFGSSHGAPNPGSPCSPDLPRRSEAPPGPLYAARESLEGDGPAAGDLRLARELCS